MHAGTLIRTIVIAVALATAVTACGRRAALDTPYEAAREARREASRNNEPLPPEPEPPVEDRPFVLDGLI
jgi:predicted small lipoprotein YifL